MTLFVGLNIKVRQKEIFNIKYGYFYKCLPKLFYEWSTLSSKKIEGDHIRCHLLSEKEDEDELMATIDGFKAAAVILINSRNDHKILRRFVSCVSQEKTPVIIINKSDGDSLINTVNKYSLSGNVLVTVDVQKQESERLEDDMAADATAAEEQEFSTSE